MLARRLFFLGTVGPLAVLAAFGFFVWLSMSDMSRRMLDDRLAVARVSAAHVGSALRKQVDALTAAAQAETAALLSRQRDEIASALRRMRAGTFFDYALYVVDGSRRPLGWAPEDRRFAQDAPVSAPNIDLAFLTGAPALSDAYEAQFPGHKLVSISVPLSSDGRNVVRVLVGEMELAGQSLGDLLRPMREPGGRAVALVDRTGTALASTSPGEIQLPLDHDAFLARLLRDGRSAAGRCHNCHDEGTAPKRTTMAFVPLEGLPWGLLLHEDEEKLAAPVSRLLIRSVVLGAAVVLMAVVTARVLVRSVTRPIRALQESVGRMASGDLDRPVPDMGRGELASLARHVDAMRVRLRGSREEIRRHSTELDGRVRERTAELDAANRELRANEAGRRALIKRLIMAQEAERRRIARDIHDEPCQTLAALSMDLDAAATATQSEASRQRLDRLRAIAVRAMEAMRTVVEDLRPKGLEELGLESAVQSCVADTLERRGVTALVEVQGMERRLPIETETAIFRIVQEAVANVSRHAEASNARVAVERNGRYVRIEVEDDGKGFGPETVNPSMGTRGLGILGMRERASLLGGKLVVESDPGSGTTVLAEIPLPDAEVAA
jgi:two-component system sensor histidine kinase UhpB